MSVFASPRGDAFMLSDLVLSVSGGTGASRVFIFGDFSHQKLAREREKEWEREDRSFLFVSSLPSPRQRTTDEGKKI